MILFNWYESFILSRIDRADFVQYRKAQILLYLISVFIVSILCFILAGFGETSERFNEILLIALPTLFVSIIIILTLFLGKITYAANIHVLFSSFVICFWFLQRPPHLAGASIGTFMFLCVVFATMFCTVLLSCIVFAAFIITNYFYYFVMVKPHFTGMPLEICRVSLFDTTMTLTLTFLICLFMSNTLTKALAMSKEELSKNVENFIFINNLLSTLKDAYNKLTASITNNREIASQLADNAQSQAAAVEELTATIEQISSNTDSVVQSTEDQHESIYDLSSSIEEMSGTIDSLEQVSSNIGTMFSQLMTLTKEGQKASELLDTTNRKISSNSSDILSVLGIMEGFFDRINLLALNATIEAARAGLHGRGFAVVAEEIGKLSENSSNELKQISSLLERNRKDAEDGTVTINEIIQFIKKLTDSFTMVMNESSIALQKVGEQKVKKEMMNSKTGVVKNKSEIIERAMTEQKIAIDEVVKTIETTSRVIQNNAENTEDLKRNAEDLNQLAVELQKKFNSD